MSQRLSVAEPLAPAPARSSVGAFELLQSSEQWWARDLFASLRGAASAGAQRRRSLVFDALLAYDQFRQAQAPHADPLTVFRRWPVCTVVALVALAAAQTDTSMFRTTLRKRERLSVVDGETGALAPANRWTYVATQFYVHLATTLGWRQMSIAGAAQTVQRSAFLNAYAKHEHAARSIRLCHSASPSEARIHAPGLAPVRTRWHRTVDAVSALPRLGSATTE